MLFNPLVVSVPGLTIGRIIFKPWNDVCVTEFVEENEDLCPQAAP